MQTVTSADLQRHLGTYTDRALTEPVLVTRNGRERIVMLSASEYQRLKQLDRRALAAWELSPDELASIASAEVPAEYAHLDDELK